MCLLHSLAKTDLTSSDKDKQSFFLLFNVCGGTILLFYVIYFFLQIRRYKSRLCPGGKVSCIGKYQRNVLDFITTVKLALVWGSFPIFRQFVLLTYAHLDEQVSPQHVFYIDTLLWTLFSDVFYTYLNLRLKRIGIPSINEIPRATNFSDLSKHGLALEGREAIVDNGNKRTSSYLKRQTLSFERVNQESPRFLKRDNNDVPVMLVQGDEGTSEGFVRFTEEPKRLPQKFSYFSKLRKERQPKTVLDIREDNIKIWHQGLEDSSKKILLYSRHMNVVYPKNGDI